MKSMSNLPLGKKTIYSQSYDPTLLRSIPRILQREKLQLKDPIPFYGIDIWNCYEFSYLNSLGKPKVLILEIYIDALSNNIIESKSMKLYLLSFQYSRFNSCAEVIDVIRSDLSKVINGKLEISFKDLVSEFSIITPNAKLIDNLDIECNEYQVNPNLLTINSSVIVTEQLYSNLLKSNCLITHQPDWATIIFYYTGPKILENSLLKYIVSYRNHSEFHEHCIERIFCDIMEKCAPFELTVYARYTRRGGIDINPFRTNKEDSIPENFRLARQ